jgi:hypothetical protein
MSGLNVAFANNCKQATIPSFIIFCFIVFLTLRRLITSSVDECLLLVRSLTTPLQLQRVMKRELNMNGK